MIRSIRTAVLVVVSLFAFGAALPSCGATTTSLVANPTNPAFGAPVTFTASVTPSPGSAGTVSFFLDGSPNAVAVVPLTNGSASFTTSGLGAGTHSMVASYSGAPGFPFGSDPSTSDPATVTVGTTSTVTGSHPGALIVGPGTSVLVSQATVGSVIVQSGGAVDVESSSIASLSASGASALRLCASTVKGSVTVNGAQGFVLIGDSTDDACPINTIGGSLTLQNNTHGVEAIGNHVAGAVNTSGNSGTGAFPEDSAPDISGNGPSGALTW